jgi:hypothetical protein
MSRIDHDLAGDKIVNFRTTEELHEEFKARLREQQGKKEVDPDLEVDSLLRRFMLSAVDDPRLLRRAAERDDV